MQNPHPSLNQRLPMPHRRLRLMVAKNRRHRSHEFDLGELLARTIPHALGPGDEGAPRWGHYGFVAEAAACGYM